jgi:hypothetical protein
MVIFNNFALTNDLSTMTTVPQIEKILSQIRKLDYESRLFLTQKLLRQMRKDREKHSSPVHYLIELESLGSEIWKDINIDEYVQQERQWD